jgi:DNA-binding NarL/FixJ family response regulator
MKHKDPDLYIPSILLVDDEEQIHSSVRLRLGDHYRLVNALNPKDALEIIEREPIDLCIVDVQMPGMNGLTFIEEARKVDPALGYVIFSGFDSDENLRRAIPLQVFEFLPKPLPDRSRFERVLPEWIERTRTRRKELALAKNTATLVRDLELARIEREVEMTASESARDALFQTAGMLTTAQALLLNAAHILEPAIKADPKLSQALRSLREARNQVDVASGITDEYFGSAYANRDSSAAIVDSCSRHAIAIAQRLAGGSSDQQAVDHRTLGREVAVAGLTGIDFLILLVPLVLQALTLATPGTTSRVQCDSLARLDEAHRGMRGHDFMWINRRNALLSSPGILLSILANADAPLEADAAAWLRGNGTDKLPIPIHGLISGVQKSKGLAGVAIRPDCQRFEILVALPV